MTPQHRPWRPSHQCLYIIPEVLGQAQSLETILNKILPLRISNYHDDKLIMLGNYIDYSEDSLDVIKILFNLQQEYQDRIILLKGRQEDLFLKAMTSQNEQDYSYWLRQGGMFTINGLIKKFNLKVDALFFPRTRVLDFFDKELIDFMQNMPVSYQQENYFFFHGSFNHFDKIENTSAKSLIWDTTAATYLKKTLKNKDKPIFKDNYVYIGAFNHQDTIPYIYKQYFMLGGTLPKKMLIMDLNSMKIMGLRKNTNNLSPIKFKYFE